MKVENGKWKVESGKWKMESGKWKMESGKWKVENGKLKMENTEVGTGAAVKMVGPRCYSRKVGDIRLESVEKLLYGG